MVASVSLESVAYELLLLFSGRSQFPIYPTTHYTFWNFRLIHYSFSIFWLFIITKGSNYRLDTYSAIASRQPHSYAVWNLSSKGRIIFYEEGGSVDFHFGLQDFFLPPPFCIPKKNLTPPPSTLGTSPLLDPLKNVTPPPPCFTKHMRKQSVVLFLNTVCASFNNTQALASISKSVVSYMYAVKGSSKWLQHLFSASVQFSSVPDLWVLNWCGLCIKQNLCKFVFERETNSGSVVQLALWFLILHTFF